MLGGDLYGPYFIMKQVWGERKKEEEEEGKKSGLWLIKI